jgi:hypothetical protein
MWICRATQKRIQEQENIARQQVYRLSIQSSGYVPSIKYGIVGKLKKDRQRAGTKLHRRRWGSHRRCAVHAHQKADVVLNALVRVKPFEGIPLR